MEFRIFRPSSSASNGDDSEAFWSFANASLFTVNGIYGVKYRGTKGDKGTKGDIGNGGFSKVTAYSNSTGTTGSVDVSWDEGNPPTFVYITAGTNGQNYIGTSLVLLEDIMDSNTGSIMVPRTTASTSLENLQMHLSNKTDTGFTIRPSNNRIRRIELIY